MHWLDGVALSPPAVRRHLALSATVADRPGYFPPGTDPIVAHCPSDLPSRTGPGGSYLFTASRLDGPKRFDLLVDAMAHVPQEIPLLIGGTGPLGDDLRAPAAADRRVKFLGFVPDHDLSGFYADALAVPFVPADEDYGLITVEAMASGTPVVTCTDSGGPTELVVDGANGLVVDPTPAALGAALSALAADPARARQMGRAGVTASAEITWASTIATILGRAATRAVLAGGRRTGPEPAAAAVVPEPAPTQGRGADDVRDRRAPPRRPAPLRPPLRRARPPLRRRGPRPRRARSPGGGPGARAGLLTSGRSPAPPTTSSSAGARRTARASRSPTSSRARTSSESPAYLETLRQRWRDGAAVLLAEPYLLPALEAVGSDQPSIYDAFNVEAELKAGALPAATSGAGSSRTWSPSKAARCPVRPRSRRARSRTPVSCRIATARARRLHGRAQRHRLQRAGPDAPGAGRRDAPGGWRSGPARPAGRRSPSGWPCSSGAGTRRTWRRRRSSSGSPRSSPRCSSSWAARHGDAFADRRVPDNVVFTGQVIRAGEAHAARRGRRRAEPDAARVGHQPQGDRVPGRRRAGGVDRVRHPWARRVEASNRRHLLVAEPHEMVDAIEAVLADPEAAHARARAGRALATERYDWNALGSQLAQVAHIAGPTGRGIGGTPTSAASL